VTTAFNQTFGVFSPDGRWVAYASDESGKFDIYIDSFPKPGSRLRVTTAGGTEPRWRADGRELYFRRGSEVHAVILTRAGPPSRPEAASARSRRSSPDVSRAEADPPDVSAMNRLFDAGAAVRSYDVSPDGRRFLINLPASSAARVPITIVHHWK
jgi:hypothetical protein